MKMVSLCVQGTLKHYEIYLCLIFSIFLSVKMGEIILD